MPIIIGAVGTAEAESTVEIRAQVTGQLGQIHFAEGQDVRKGQLLFSLDARPFEATLRQAQAMLERDSAQADNAELQRKRAEELSSQGLIARNDYDTQVAGATALQATVAADNAQVDQARLNLQYARIASPIDGRTGALMTHVGDLVRANDTTPLVTINQIAPIYVTFSIPGRYLADVRRYQVQRPLTVNAKGQSSALNPDRAGNKTDDPSVKGTVTFIDNAVDPTTGTVKLKAAFPNTDHELWPGLFAQVSLQVATEPNAIVVPAVAVQASQQGQYVYVVKRDRTVELRNVTTARQQGDEMVIATGLSKGEEVVTDGQLRLTPGTRVTETTTDPAGS